MSNVSMEKPDSELLSALNAQFIRNFLERDAAAHDQIIHKDFLCIQGNGSIVSRDEYLKNWASAYERSGYTSFAYGDERIRIFGNMALVRSTTSFTINVDGKELAGSSVYTDVYIKENGVWLCVQAQLTPVK